MYNDIPRTFIGTTTVRVEGMTCHHCEQAVAAAIRAVRGVDSLAIDLTAGTVTVVAGRPLDRADIATAVEETGHTVIA